MPDTTLDPQAIAKAVAIEVADEDNQVGDFVEAIDLGDDVTDFRFETRVRGYEGWQWSVTLYHDVELDHWTVNESSLVPTDKALRPPAWIPWKDRLEPTDLAVTDSIGTEPDDPRLEEGFRATDAGEGAPAETPEMSETSETSKEDVEDAVEEFELSRRHVLTPLGRAQTAKRWYEGPRGPKSLSTKTADGNPCSTCGFFIPLKGELNLLFGVCANKWSPDDGRVVSVDHGCGEHSEIEPPEPSHLWMQSKPAFDDLHIDIIAQAPREERGSVELIEQLEGEEPNPNDEEEASEEDIEANTINDNEASQEDVQEHAEPADSPEVETTLDLSEDEETEKSSDDEEPAETGEQPVKQEAGETGDSAGPEESPESTESEKPSETEPAEPTEHNAFLTLL
ncbi:MAG: DUF3027 domain-containing protein [Bifidobacterium dentium]|nr:DUF3027 domain-containing protein [Bifidobacterium dentium]